MDATIILIFFKTIFLVIVFSLLHGIVFLPILLTVTMPDDSIGDAWRQRAAKDRTKEGTGSSGGMVIDSGTETSTTRDNDGHRVSKVWEEGHQ